MADLKLVYKADTEDLALAALDNLEENWGKKYPASIASWRNNWPQLSTYFKYPSEIRKLIYTTNSIENFNRQLRKVTKSKTIFQRTMTIQNAIFGNDGCYKKVDRKDLGLGAYIRSVMYLFWRQNSTGGS